MDLKTYAEVTADGRGVLILLKGELPKKGRSRSDLGIRIFSGNRMITLTGRKLGESESKIGSN